MKILHDLAEKKFVPGCGLGWVRLGVGFSLSLRIGLSRSKIISTIFKGHFFKIVILVIYSAGKKIPPGTFFQKAIFFGFWHEALEFFNNVFRCVK